MRNPPLVLWPNIKQNRSIPSDVERRYYNEGFEELTRIFSKKGAYSKYKLFLERCDGLDHWYEFQRESTKKALLEWCARHDIEVDI